MSPLPVKTNFDFPVMILQTKPLHFTFSVVTVSVASQASLNVASRTSKYVNIYVRKNVNVLNSLTTEDKTKILANFGYQCT